MDKRRPEPNLVLNGVISTDTTVMLSISRTRFFTDTGRYEIVKDALVSLWINGAFGEQMTWAANESFYGGGIYVSGYKPQTGDIIRIEAATKYGEAWAEETVPAGVRIEDVTFSHKLIYDHTGYGVDKNGDLVEIPTLEIAYRITFTDKAETADFYLIRIDDPSPLFDFAGNLDYSSDPVFVEQVSVIDGLFGDKTIQGQGGRTFTDHILNGQRYTLVIKETHPITAYRGQALDRRIALYAISESYYRYLTSMQLSADADNSANLSTFGFTDPVRIFSAIRGGVDVMARLV
jgi:hypothetical protein